MIRIRDGDQEYIVTIDDFEDSARRGEISPFAEVCIPALTGDRFVQARELPLFSSLYDPRRALFRRHFHLGRYPLVTGLLALACVLLFLYARHLGDGAVTRDALIDLGAKARARILDEGQLWRVLTANILHRDATHLAFNLFALLNIGTVLEGVYRRGDYVLLLIIGGIATMGLSTVASGPVTVGASGVIFACLGCAVVFGLRFSEMLPLRYRIYFGVVVVGYAAVMFYLGLQRPTTDNWGHGGGLLAGVLMGAFLEPRLLRLREAKEPRRVMLVPWITAAVLVFVVVAAGPLVPRLWFRYEPYRLDAFGIVIERPSTWSKGPDPLGYLAFGNGVDALVSVACERPPGASNVNEATARFIDHELRSAARASQIGELRVGAPAIDSVGVPPRVVAARRVAFSFIASDGPFEATASIFARGEMECAFVLARRESASPQSQQVLDEVRRRLQLVDTKAQRDAKNAVLNKPESPRAHLDLALAHQAAGDVDAARRSFAEAERLLGGDAAFNARVLGARARFELDQGGDLDAALARAEVARLASNTDPDIALLLIDVLLRRGELQRARIALDAARAQFSDEQRLVLRDQQLRALE